MHQKIYIILFLKISYTSHTEDEAQGTFELNYINATIVYQYHSP
jgi:hypothetical protein